MIIKNYLESTYLKTHEQAGISIKESLEVVKSCIQEAIETDFKVIMIRPNHVQLAKKMVQKANAKINIGTVISFPEGTNTTSEKIVEAKQAIQNGADELDFVCNYQAFRRNEIELVKNEIFEATQLALSNNKTIKWIIEVAALNPSEIIRLCCLIKNVVISNFKDADFAAIYIKTSTGFYKTIDNLPNGATNEAIIMMLENSFPLAIKASGGIQSFEQASKFIQLGVKRIGTSNAKIIWHEQISKLITNHKKA